MFVYQLIKNSDSIVDEHRVLIHRPDTISEYLFENIRVHILPTPHTQNYRKSYFSRRFDDLPGFMDLLNSFKPEVVHFHDQSEGASLNHLECCQQMGIKTVLTYHSPGQSCLQRALIQDGQRPCDGWIDIHRCTACRYKVKGFSLLISNALAGISIPLDPTGKFLMSRSTGLFQQSWKEFYKQIDVVQVHAQWVKELLLRNGVTEKKIRFIELGGFNSLSESERTREKVNKLFKIVFVGRCTDIKGVHLLIEAVQLLGPEKNLEVHFFGPDWSDQYGSQLLEQVGPDSRFQKPRLIPGDRMIEELKAMDICVIPSLWPETGPFVLFDAFAAGLPVIATDLAGLQERIRDGVDGLLFKWNDVDDLRGKLEQLLNDQELFMGLRRKIKTNRTFLQMSEDFKSLYRSLTG